MTATGATPTPYRARGSSPHTSARWACLPKPPFATSKLIPLSSAIDAVTTRDLRDPMDRSATLRVATLAPPAPLISHLFPKTRPFLPLLCLSSERKSRTRSWCQGDTRPTYNPPQRPQPIAHASRLCSGCVQAPVHAGYPVSLSPTPHHYDADQQARGLIDRKHDFNAATGSTA